MNLLTPFAKKVETLPLAERIASALTSPDTSSASLAALVDEVTEAQEVARTQAAEAEARALDPTLNATDADLAANASLAASFTVRRLNAAATRLSESRDKRQAEEHVAEQWERYRVVEKLRDAAAERIRSQYPELARKMVELIKLAVETDGAVLRINRDLPPGAPLLNGAEAEARGFIFNGRDGNPGHMFAPLGLSCAVIPDPDQDRWEYALWPLGHRSDTDLRGNHVAMGERAKHWHLSKASGGV